MWLSCWKQPPSRSCQLAGRFVIDGRPSKCRLTIARLTGVVRDCQQRGFHGYIVWLDPERREERKLLRILKRLGRRCQRDLIPEAVPSSAALHRRLSHGMGRLVDQNLTERRLVNTNRGSRPSGSSIQSEWLSPTRQKERTEC